jgi:hypothetical protein
VWTRERGAAQVVGREDPSILVLHRNDTIRRRREEEECGEGLEKKDPIRLPLIGINNCRESRKSID